MALAKGLSASSSWAWGTSSGGTTASASTLASLGLLLGARHALEADHVVAVFTLVSHSRSVLAAARLGLYWGLGHTAMPALCGLPVLFLRLRIPAGAERLELAVAAMLVVLGVLTVRDHAHSHAVPGGLRALLVGMVHGLASTAAMSAVTLAMAVPVLLSGERLPALRRVLGFA